MTRKRQFTAAAILTVWLIGPAAAAPVRKPHNAVPPEPIPKALGSALETIAALPPDLAGWRRGEMTDFSQRPGGPGLGAAVEYRSTAGPGVATVYAYDRGLPAMREGTGAPELADELSKAVSEIAALSQFRGYAIQDRGPGLALPGLRCETTQLAFSGGPRADALVCATIHNGRFLKLRVTTPAGGASQAAAFGEALLQAAR
jgi:hypothetical protein